MIKRICFFSAFFISILFAINYFPKKAYAKETNIIQESDDVEIISNPITPKLKMRIVFKEELSIGVTEGDENYMFGNDVVGNTDNEGNFYVTDWDRKRIQKYDSEGKFLLTIGRPGQGPGEFRNISKVRFDSENNLYVIDIVSRRISLFNPQGAFLKMIKSPIGLSHKLYINSQGFFVFREAKIIEHPDGTGAFVSIYGLFDNKFDLITEFYREINESGPPARRDKNSIAKSLAENMSEDAFRPKVNFIMSRNDYVYFGYPEKYEIKVFNPEGILVKIIQKDYEPIRVSQKDIESYAQNYKETIFKYLPISDDIKAKAIRLAEYPKYKPAYKNFTFMENAWLLVIADSLEDEYALIDIFNQEGKYISQFTTTIPTSGLFFKNGKAYAIAEEDGYKFVKRYHYEIQEYRDKRWVRKK